MPVLLAVLACLLCNSCGGRRSKTLPPAARVSMSPEDMERAVFGRVNAYRRSQGLAGQGLDPRMSELAREHSRWMASRKMLSHRGSGRRFRDLQGEPVGLVSFAENVAVNFGHADPVGVAVDGWVRSAGHQRNMTRRDDQLTGVGVAQAKDGSWYLTQLFGRR